MSDTSLYIGQSEARENTLLGVPKGEVDCRIDSTYHNMAEMIP